MSAPSVVVLAVDIGSSSVRSRLFDIRGDAVTGTAARRPHRFSFSAGGRAEADAGALADLVIQCVDETLGSPAAGGPIHAVAMCTFMHGLMGADAEGRALTPVLTWADTRSSDQAARLAARADAESVRQRTGCPPHAIYFPAKLLWLRENEPRLVRDVRWWGSVGEYCLRAFTGTASCSLSIASATGLLDRAACAWDRPVLEAAGLDESLLSPLRDTDQPCGVLLPRFARRWPALREARWFAPLGDGACSNVGCGCDTPGRIALMIGTTGAVRTVRAAGQDPWNVPPGLWAYRLDGSRELAGGVLGDGGNLFEWMTRTLSLGMTPAEIDAAVLAAVPAAHGLAVLPFLAGERSTGWNPALRGAVVGMHLGTTSLDIVQAGMEAVAYRFAAIMRLLRAGIPGLHEVIGTGGALRLSSAWGQIVSDVLQQPVSCSEEAEASSRGAALLALRALGYGAGEEFSPPRIARTFFPRRGSAEAHAAAIREQERLRSAILGEPRDP